MMTTTTQIHPSNSIKQLWSKKFFLLEYISCSMYRRKTMLVCGMRRYASAGDDFTAHKILVWRTKKIEGKNRHHDHHCWTLHKRFWLSIVTNKTRLKMIFRSNTAIQYEIVRAIFDKFEKVARITRCNKNNRLSTSSLFFRKHVLFCFKRSKQRFLWR